MSGVNQAIILGRLGKDPETKSFGEGKNVTNFSIATSRKSTKDGEEKEWTTWHNIRAFGKLADITAKYLKKGRQVYVQGEFRTDTWEDEAGAKKYASYIVANQVQFIGDAPTEDSGGREAAGDMEAADTGTTKTATSTGQTTTTTKPTKKVKNHAPGADNGDDEMGF